MLVFIKAPTFRVPKNKPEPFPFAAWQLVMAEKEGRGLTTRTVSLT